MELVPGHHITIEDTTGRNVVIAKRTIKWVTRNAVPVQVRDPNDPEWVLVELKSGAALHGELVELVPGEHLIVATEGRNIRLEKSDIRWVHRRVAASLSDLDPELLKQLLRRAATPPVTPSAAASANTSPLQTATSPRIEHDELGHEAFQSGREAFGAGHYREALSSFELAYKLSHRKELLYNIGLAAEAAGEARRAIDAYQQYLRERPDSELRQAIRERVAGLQQQASVEGARTP